ncbi:drug/metabolite transporter (DMT)-like permease [Aureimonas pseudogalii]|uniref:Drug/metabolite transporter (DMT)-like permease n=2 Tax=Aureimonas pseudogalii TaxID=1744844 RepID=A0A7W6H4C6_9HYPH|nr:drug/metabolite transporter (DMT)-like permease [Aureimonas pseudogalii]
MGDAEGYGLPPGFEPAAPRMTSNQSLLAGIGLTVVAGATFAGMDALGKHLTTLVPVLQVIWGRYFVQTVLMTGYLATTTGTGFLRTAHPVLQILRGIMLLASTGLMYTALTHVPLADATAVLFFTPIVVTLLSVLVLRETIGLHRIGAIVAGFAGMLLILRPGFGAIHPALGLALAASVTNAIYLMLTRHLAGREDAASTQFNTTAAGALILTLLVVPVWQTPAPSTLALMLAIGVVGTIGHFTLVRAFASAPASLLSPFLYSQVLTAAVLSLAVFGDPLRGTTILGTLVLVASGVTIWWRENRRRLAA